MDSKMTEIDQRGDLILRLGAPKTNDLRVCSRAIACASTVFDKALFGSSEECQKQAGEWIVELHEDNVALMIVLLAIAHGCERIIPTRVTVPELFELLVIGERYKMRRLFRPYLRRWIPNNKNVKLIDDKMMLAWIAREIGSTTLFEAAMIDIARHLTNDGIVGYFIGDKNEDKGSVFNSCIRSSGILDIAAAKQTDLLKRVLEPIQELTRRALRGQSCQKYLHGAREAQLCADALLGLLVAGCKQVGVDPNIMCLAEEVDLASYPYPVSKVFWAVGLMRYHTIAGHAECSVMNTMKIDTWRAFTTLAVAMSPSEQMYFRMQAEISGFS
ncbi:hypothetical protein LX36DRAFT_724240 [Colletotrichum falcatum]|nr:hypothetical protein LX36DRAFT_724240 [Colletotrichum falcatum]